MTPGARHSFIVLACPILLFAGASAVRAVCPDCDGDGFAAPYDCDDTNPAVHPGAVETCNGVDDNCDGYLDENLTQPCTSGCGAGTETCRNGIWLRCSAKPCCDCSVGPGQPYATLCDAGAGGCTVACLTPGVHPNPGGCTLPRSLAGSGRDVTTIDGDLLGGIRIQGVTVTGTVNTGCDPDPGNDYFDNRILGSLTTCNERGPATLAQVVGNEVTGSLTAAFRYSVRDNVVGAFITMGNTASYVDAVGNDVRGAGGALSSGISFGQGRPGKVVVERNRIDAAGIGVQWGSFLAGTRQFRAVGNRITNCGTGFALNAAASTVLVLDNVVLDARDIGIDASGVAIPSNLLVQHNVVARTGMGSPDPSLGIGLRLADNQEQAIPPTPSTVRGNTLVGNGKGMVASCPTCPNYAIQFEGNIVVMNATSGVERQGPLQFNPSLGDVFGNGADWVGLPDPTGSNGNIAADPLLRDPAAGDFRLRPGSPCVDTGAPSVYPDPDGVFRPIDGDLDGTPLPDIGVYEMRAEVFPVSVSLAPYTLTWPPYPPATAGFDLYSGLLSGLKATGSFTTQDRLCGWPTEAFPVPQASPLGDGHFFEVVPHGAVAGSLGTDSQGVERVNSHPCP